MFTVRVRPAYPVGLAALLVACAGGTSQGGATGGAGQTQAKPNLIVIVVDDWAYSDFVASREDPNPWNNLIAIDSLATQGQVWENFYSQPLCNPTRKTLTFGIYTGDALSPVCRPPKTDSSLPGVPVALALAEQGYATAAFGKWHIDRSTQKGKDWWEAPAEYGFQHWRALSGINVGGHCDSRDYFDWTRADDGVPSHTTAYHTEAVGFAFMDWWQNTQGPRFAYVCFQAAHGPYAIPPSYLLPSGSPSPKEPRDVYDEMLVAMDTLIGVMLGVVDFQDTYICIVGDNGTPAKVVRSDQNPRRVKWTTYEDGVNVPMVVAGPGITPGLTQALGHVVDLPATLLELAGVPKSASMVDSVSLAPVLRDAASRPRHFVVSDLEPTNNPNYMDRDTSVVLDTESGLFKARYITLGSTGAGGTRSYFDLSLDPAERVPLAVGDPAYADAMEESDGILQEFLGIGGSGPGGGVHEP